MKKIYLALALILGFCFPQLVAATEQYQADVATLQPITLTEVTAKIKAKETFYLYIGREDSFESQRSASQVSKVATASQHPIYYLNTKGIDAKKYRAFSKKYNIRAVTYLSQFSGRKQVAVYKKGWQAELTDLLAFLNPSHL